MGTFNADVLRYLTEEKWFDADLINTFYETYAESRKAFPGLPPEEKTTVEDVIALQQRGDAADGTPWEQVKAKAIKEYEKVEASNDVFLPLWVSKSQNTTSAWLKDTFGRSNSSGTRDGGQAVVEIDPKLVEAYNKAFKTAAPPIHLSTQERISRIPADPIIIDDFVQAIKKSPRLFVQSVGFGEDPTFRWGPAVCMFGGLGLEALRTMARRLQDEEGWGHFLSLTDDELMKEIVNAHVTSGYPLALLRVDFDEINRLVETLDYTPYWYASVIISHMFKHIRLAKRGGETSMIVQYKGSTQTFKLTAEQMQQNLASRGWSQLAPDVKRVLKLPVNPGRGRTTPQASAVANVFGRLLPSMFIELHDLREIPEIIVPPGISFVHDSRITPGYSFINTGWCITDCSRLNTATGRVQHNTVVQGAEVMTYNWPLDDSVTREQLVSWRSNLPKTITAERPSETVLRVIKNINFLGEEKAFKALMDSIIIIGLTRELLVGTPLGETAAKQFPLVFVYPESGVLEETTNQGKTTFCKAMGGILAPDIQVQRVLPIDSPPALRCMARPVQLHGTCIYDEFSPPKALSHLLHYQGLQSYASGTPMNAGEAGKDSGGIYLKFPLFLNSKACSAPPDIMNRQFAVIMKALTDETRLDGDTLDLISSGKLPLQARMNTLWYIKKTGLLEKMRTMSLCASSTWRWSAHLALAVYLADGDEACIKRYLDAVNEQCSKQLEEADDSGLLDQVGIKQPYKLNFFWDECADLTLESLHLAVQSAESAGSGLSVLEAIRVITENGGRRHFDSVLRSFGNTERQAITNATAELKKKPMVKSGWELSLVPTAESKLRNPFGKVMNQCTLKRIVKV